MGRVERFRQKRILRQKYLVSLIIFILLLSIGIGAADYSVNNLLGGEKKFNIISINNNKPNVELFFMNQKLVLDTEYVSRDLERLRQCLSRLLGG